MDCPQERLTAKVWTRIHPSTLADMKEIAEKEQRDQSELIRLAVEQYRDLYLRNLQPAVKAMLGGTS